MAQGEQEAAIVPKVGELKGAAFCLKEARWPWEDEEGSVHIVVDCEAERADQTVAQVSRVQRRSLRKRYMRKMQMRER